MGKKINKLVMITIILAVLLLGCLVYMGVKSYKEKQNELYLQGAQYGYQSAVAQFIQSGMNCTPVNVYIQNKTMQFVDVSCLSATK